MIVVTGHLCIDVIPQLASGAELEPGALVEAGEVSFATGGAVANVGLSLARLGLEPALVAKVGDDPFGEILTSLLGRSGAAATLAVVPATGEATSYSIVLSRPGFDRTFLHHPGCNHSFTAADIEVDRWRDSDIVHFGYPPLMRGIYRDSGEALARAFSNLRGAGVTVSLDMALPDATGESGRVDWNSFLETVLPHVDLFLPSWDETAAMLSTGAPRTHPDAENLSRTAERLLELGPAVVGLKLGDDGFYLRTAEAERMAAAGRGVRSAGIARRELLSPNFKVDARGTTGAGDATIAGLLAALAKGLTFEDAVNMASAVGAQSVEGVDATSGVESWEAIGARLSAGWPRMEAAGLVGAGWHREEANGLLLGPFDGGGA